ncbi:MAG: AAA family ATPase, partial [Candidatus Marinimicrobia bacterium]|nr:AAA family ATPase [Candidatus Neomarinimicrobiota bacterium]
VNFKNAIIIMTSNLGSQMIMGQTSGVNEENIDVIYANIQETVLSQLREHLRPEFLNRVDEVIVFRPLLPSDIEKIVQLQFNRLALRMRSRGIDAELTDEARSIIARASWDPAYGARPVKRMIQKHILDPLAGKILKGQFNSGDKINIIVKNGEIKFEKT